MELNISEEEQIILIDALGEMFDMAWYEGEECFLYQETFNKPPMDAYDIAKKLRKRILEKRILEKDNNATRIARPA